jgi:hypothetical protein
MTCEYKLFFDGPSQSSQYQPYTWYSQGSSPYLLEELLRFFDEYKSVLKEINISLYLFNNENLVDKLIELANNGTLINIISIPIDGYDDDYPKNITDMLTGEITHQRKTKLDLAKLCYEKISKVNNISLYIFNHVFVRSSRIKIFSRGDMPYSLHIKSFYFKMQDGTSYSFVTSSNLAVRDTVKEEMMVRVKNDNSTEKATELFFKALIEESCLFECYNSKDIYSVEHRKPNKLSHDRVTSFYTAPFFHRSPELARKYITTMLLTAKSRVYIVGQHVSTFSEQLGQVRKNNSSVEINILSQTYIDDTVTKIGNKNHIVINNKCEACRVPENKYNFNSFTRSFKNNNTGNYYFNTNVHLKFIIVDDRVIISTSNFTETEFIFKELVNISHFEHFKGSYVGTYAEVGQYLFIDRNSELANQLVNHFENIISLDSTCQPIGQPPK